jgi:UTP--glucose-1-phosphate uridylyltransferase
MYEKTGASVIAVEPVSAEDVSKYGIIAGHEVEAGVWRVTDLVEKPEMGTAPSNLAITGRYLLTPRVMEILEMTQPGSGGEIQLTDALLALLKDEEIYAVVFDSDESYDTGNMVGWFEANLRLGLKDPRYHEPFRMLIETV